jgi:hypothetical protein
MEWYVEKARAMFAQGMKPYAIARDMHVSIYKIEMAVDPAKYRKQALERNKRRQAELASERPRHYSGLHETHVPRQIKQILDPKVRDEAVRAFAAGKIDRAELSRRLHQGSAP